MENLQQILVVELYDNHLHQECVEALVHIAALAELTIDEAEETAVEETEEGDAYSSEVVIERLHDSVHIGYHGDVDEVLQAFYGVNFDTET